jgi:peptidoglycan/LPS O-acetylase OafA/YrhL
MLSSSVFDQRQNEGHSMPEHPIRIPSLDGLRAVSIALVVISHLIWIVKPAIPSAINPLWIDNLGPLGVRVFFVISGYLISRLLFGNLDAQGQLNLPRFYFRRTLRIFVPYYFFLSAVVVLAALGWINLASDDLRHALTYTVNYYPERSWNVGHGWSLSVEEQFYLLWPAILLLVGKRRGLAIAFAFTLAAPFIRLGYSYFAPSLVRYELTYRFETAADAIAVGCLLAGTQRWLEQRSLFQRVLRSRLFVLVPLIILYASELDPSLKRSMLFGVSVQNLGIAACLAWCISNPSGRLGRLLNSVPLTFIGMMSYSIYLWQQIFLNPRSNSLFTSFPLNLFLVALTALGSYFLVERPALRLRHWLEPKIFSRRDTAKQDSRVVAG